MSGALGPTRRLIGDRFTLALGGGGGRGWAHIGVARALDEAGMRPSLIVGTSIGSVVGAGLAAGFSPDAIERLAAETPINELIGRPGRLALFDPQRLMERMAELLGDPTFDQLPIPFAVSAYDLAAGRRVGITSGKVVEAVQRSIAVPAFFPPCPDEEGVWCDAGPWESVPVSLARQLSPDPVIGVWIYPAKPGILASRGVAWTLRRMGRWLRPASEGALTRRRFAALLAARLAEPVIDEQPDLMIRPRLAHLNPWQLEHVAVASRSGYEAARRALSARGMLPAAPEAVHAT